MNSEYHRTYYQAHREHYRALRKAKYESSPGSSRERNLKNKYGITLAQYDEMFAGQQGRCAICAKHQSELKMKLAVDHDHATGQVRGLLCNYCNRFLAVVEDRKFVEKASEYLLKSILGTR